MAMCGQDTYLEGYSLGRVTPTDRQTEGHTYRQIQKTEPSATRRPVRSAPGYFTSDSLFSWYCKVQFCRHTGATIELCKQVVDNACSLFTCRISVGRHRWGHGSCLSLNKITIQVFCLIFVDLHAVPESAGQPTLQLADNHIDLSSCEATHQRHQGARWSSGD